jgi:hypothetical protein
VLLLPEDNVLAGMMPVLPRPQRMTLHAAISYVMERCNCQQYEASKALYFALCEDKLQAIANKLVRDLAPAPGLIGHRDQPRGIVGHVGSGYADTGLHPVPSEVWCGYSWLGFDARSSPRGNPQFHGKEVSILYSNPRIATADIDGWLGPDGDRHNVPADPSEEGKGLIREPYETSEMKPGVLGFKIDLKPIFNRIGRCLRLR